MSTIKPIKICAECNQEFTPKSSRQKYCNREIVRNCPVCNKPYIDVCNATPLKSTCGDSECQTKLILAKRAESASKLTRICKWCGKEFHPKEFKQNYCDDVHYQKCQVCGKQFIIDPVYYKGAKTCSEKCRQMLTHTNIDYTKMMETLKHTLQTKYGVDNPMQIPESVEKIKQTTLERYGSEWYTQTEEYKEKSKATCLAKYGVEHHLMADEVKAKRTLTVLERYGSTNIFSSEEGKSKIRKRLKERYGVINPSQDPVMRKKALKAARISKLEIKVASLLTEYNIEYEDHYMVKKDDFCHEFDFYLPKYKILIDCDGLYFHSYLDDPNGKHVLDYYDETRIALAADGYIFHVIVEGQEDKDVKRLADIISQMDENIFDYEGSLFKWCRSISFPYPNYSKERLLTDYTSLCRYECSQYKPTATLGISSINHYHKSIYDARVGDAVSPKEAWEDDELLKKVIKNRLIYTNNVDPSKILKGFNISKICPRVSVFNPVLAKYLTNKYLSDYNEVFDPFSGYSGRLLGVASTGKRYIGQDLNAVAINESNQIINELNLINCSVANKDTIGDTGEYECLLTCPPYGTKERYSNESIFKSCDEWIDLILSQYKCSRYVFVVDETNKYLNNVTEEIKATSHFCRVTEKVVVI